MKKVLLASTALVLSAGVAAAEVTVGGDGRMGVIQGFLPVNVAEDGDPPNLQNPDVTFTSRIRISFSASGETDGGLSFGGSVRADNSDDGANGDAGTVFVSGAFGRLSMGDVDGAAKAAIGHVSGVGLTGLGDLNEIIYVANVGPDTPGALYEYSTGGWGFYLSADAPGDATTLGTDGLADQTDFDAYSAGVNYAWNNWTFGLGYEDTDAATISIGDPDLNVDLQTNRPVTHWVAGVTGVFGDFTGKFVYGWGDAKANADDAVDRDITQYALSGDYTFGATTLTAFYRNTEVDGAAEVEAYGLGAAYDLGGGASLVAGWADGTLTDVIDAAEYSNDTWDFGVKFSF